MTQAEWIYYTMMGEMELPFPGVEDEFLEGRECAQLYGGILDAYERICQRMGLEEDADLEIIINNFLKMNRICGLKMYGYGLRLQ